MTFTLPSHSVPTYDFMNNGIIGFSTPHIYESEEQQYVASTAYTFSLPLARRPDIFRAVMVCKIIDNGWAVGDEIGMEFIVRPAGADNCAVSAGPGQCYVITGATFSLKQKTGATFSIGSAASWTIKVYAAWLLP